MTRGASVGPQTETFTGGYRRDATVRLLLPRALGQTLAEDCAGATMIYPAHGEPFPAGVLRQALAAAA